MTRELVVRGVPQALIVDMWWLASETDSPPAPQRPGALGRADGTGGRAAALAGLVALADLLFYGHAPGLSLAVFAGAVLVAVMALNPGQPRLRPALLLAVAVLPVIDHVQALSITFLTAGLIMSLVLATGGADVMGRRILGLVRDMPLRGIIDGAALGAELSRSDLLRDHRRHVRSWAFPLGGALVLIGLLVQANPILGEALTSLAQFEIGTDWIARVFFWTGSAILVWPLIAPYRAIGGSGSFAWPRLPAPSAGSVGRGLVLFNLILAAQSGMDAIYLWGGAALPDGMTAAEYAHRGAYPLLVTALLAGAFALAARPFARENRRLRWLLMLWIGQNVALTLSALLRLEFYVEAFGLTYLRLYAAIWMGLVAGGLGLVAWQVARDLPNLWLLLRSAGMGVATLYAASFVNFAAIIAAENLSRPSFDGTYVCSLGPTAAAAIAASGRDFEAFSSETYEFERCRVDPPRIEGWRDWGFRNWRVRRYLDAMPVAEAMNEDTRRG
ncbi:MAG: DUF4173 domain-containing protein [Tabrizicola sp.]|nr:DUF4173 domain-containing protein [Tabrizicola sp.]